LQIGTTHLQKIPVHLAPLCMHAAACRSGTISLDDMAASL
jgi:hypothetical protein